MSRSCRSVGHPCRYAEIELPTDQAIRAVQINMINAIRFLNYYVLI